jgi:hypothetical protein
MKSARRRVDLIKEIFKRQNSEHLGKNCVAKMNEQVPLDRMGRQFG